MNLKYLMLFINRSGSSWLCDLLNYAELGPIKEFHQTERIEDYTNYKGLKVNLNAHEELTKQTDLSNCKLLYLKREDKISQAISWHRAIQTQQWSCKDELVHPPKFNFHKIEKTYNLIIEQEKKWNDFLKNKEYLPLIYEDLGTHSISIIAGFLGEKFNTPTQSELQIQRDDISKEWKKKFLEQAAWQP